MTLDIEKLEAAAKAATPGPWYAGSDWVTADLDFKSVLIQLGGTGAADGYDLEYIATANPQAVLELISRLREAEKNAARYRWLNTTLHSAKGGASVCVNDEFSYYEVPEEGKEVRIQWYPDTPVGFYLSEARTLSDAIDEAMKESA